MTPLTDAITPFRVAIPQTELDDLNRRLRATRWPNRETTPGWTQGVPLARAQALIAYWLNRYDWRRFEAKVNRFPQFRTRIDGIEVHFLHVKSRHEAALPLVLTHGWPGSIVEFLEVIRPLTDPTAFGGQAEDAFHVVVPSLPGFGFSDKPTEPGWDVNRIAKAWAELMPRLGYERWVSQGGDFGAGVSTALGQMKPRGLLGIHLTLPFIVPKSMPTVLSPEEQQAVDSLGHFASDGSGYRIEQATRPQTIGYALADSPVGQATWIYEKFQAWSDNTGLPEDALNIDAMLDNISLYWLTNSAASSARIYWEGRSMGFARGKVELPVGVTVFPREIFRAPRSWAEQNYPKLIYWNVAERGGHFAAFEQPVIFTREVRAAFRSLRST